MPECAKNFPFKISNSDPTHVIRASENLVIGQLGQTLDGSIATKTGDSKYINSVSGLRHLHRLREVVDAVIVGVESVNTDDPKLTVRLCDGASPVRVIIDPNNRVNVESSLFRCDASERIVFTKTGSEHAASRFARIVTLETNEAGYFDPVAIVNELQSMGLERVLVEGGNRTLSHFMRAGVLDRIHLLVAPMLIGSGISGLELPSVEKLTDAIRPDVTLYPLGEDLLFDCDLKPRAQDYRRTANMS